MLRIQQAIFTSVRGGRNDGYQLAATSPDVTPQDQRDLVQWGPAHDSLGEDAVRQGSINFHPLRSGQLCVSRTVLAGAEYSGRGGQRVYTSMFIVQPDVLSRFCNNPFRVVEALTLSGRASVREDIPAQLDPLPLLGRAAILYRPGLAWVVDQIGPERLAAALAAVIGSSAVGILAPVPPERLFSALIDLVPPQKRTQFTFTTGLKSSPRRPFRLTTLPSRGEEQRRSIRLSNMTPIDLTRDAPTRWAPTKGWALVVQELLAARQLDSLAELLREADQLPPETDLDAAIEQLAGSSG